MITLFWPEAKRLFLLVPLKVALQNDNAPILDDIHKDPLTEKFLYSSIDYHVVIALVAPLHIGQLSAVFILKLFIIHLFIWMFLHVEPVGLYNRDVGCWTDVKGSCVQLFVSALLRPSDLE